MLSMLSFHKPCGKRFNFPLQFLPKSWFALIEGLLWPKARASLTHSQVFFPVYFGGSKSLEIHCVYANRVSRFSVFLMSESSTLFGSGWKIISFPFPFQLSVAAPNAESKTVNMSWLEEKIKSTGSNNDGKLAWVKITHYALISLRRKSFVEVE